jgi:hypothetical protein
MTPTIIRRLTNTGLRRGLAGSRAWLVVGMGLVGYRIIRRIAMSDPEVLYRTAVRPGDVFEIITRSRPK